MLEIPWANSNPAKTLLNFQPHFTLNECARSPRYAALEVACPDVQLGTSVFLPCGVQLVQVLLYTLESTACRLCSILNADTWPGRRAFL